MMNSESEREEFGNEEEEVGRLRVKGKVDAEREEGGRVQIEDG